MPDALLQTAGLTVERRIDDHWHATVDQVDLRLGQGEMLGLVGESGSGKSTLLQALAGLLPRATTRIHGHARIDKIELLELNEGGWRALRGQAICWLPQNPMTAFNPVVRLGTQLVNLLANRTGGSRDQARQDLRSAMEQLDLSAHEALLERYPQSLSGGQCQRLLMALALACKPRLLLADEPTSALDITSRATLLASLREACLDRGIGVLTVSHDLALVAGHCDRLAVMYAGQMIESGPVETVFRQPAHPYTAALLAAHPAVGPGPSEDTGLHAIPGQPPAAGSWPSGCRFANRCLQVEPGCLTHPPRWSDDQPDRGWRCHYPLDQGTSGTVRQSPSRSRNTGSSWLRRC